MSLFAKHTIEIEECERQMMLIALAHLAIERPGWDYVLTQLAKKMDNISEGPSVKSRHLEALIGKPVIDVEFGKPILYEHFKFYHAEKLKHDANCQILHPGQKDQAAVQTGAGS